MPSYQEILEQKRATVREVDARESVRLREQGALLVDVREQDEVEQGIIPGAVHIDWEQAVLPNGNFRTRKEIEEVYSHLNPAEDTVVYCRVGDRAAHTWFVLKYLLGFENVRNYDGSWTEWGSAVRVPIAVGTEPGELPR